MAKEKGKFSLKLTAIILAIIVAVSMMFVFGFNGVKNKAISYEEQSVQRSLTLRFRKSAEQTLYLTLLIVLNSMISTNMKP